MHPLIPEVETELLKQRERQKHYSKALGSAYDNSFSDYVCTDEIGKLLSPNYLSRTFGKLLKQNGLRHIRYHDLRHTCASFITEKWHTYESDTGMVRPIRLLR